MCKNELLEALSGAEAPFLVMSVGVPGSGKSTVLSELSDKIGVVRINPDQIRRELTGSEDDQSRNPEVWNEVFRRAKEYLGRGESVIIDATHAEIRIGVPSRSELVEMYRGFGAKTVLAIYFKVRLETAKKRNQGRTRVVPDHVIERMYMALEEKLVSVGEGFDQIIEVNE